MPSSDGRAITQAKLSRVFDFAFELRRELRLILIYACGVGVLTLATPIAVQVLINSVALGTLLQPMLFLLLLLSMALAFAVCLEFLQVWLVELLSRRLFVGLCDRIGGAIVAAAPAQRGRLLSEKISRFLDVVVLEKSTAALLLDGSAVLLQVSLGLLLLAAYHPILLAFAAAIVAFVGLVVLPLGRGTPASAIEESSSKYAVLGALQQLSEGEALRASGPMQATTQLLQERSKAWLQARQHHFSGVLRQKLSLWVLQVAANVSLLGLGSWLVRQSQLTLGQLVAAELVMALTVGSLAKLGKLLPKLYDLNASLAKLESITNIPEAKHGSAVLPEGPLRLKSPTLGDQRMEPGRHLLLPASPELSSELAQLTALEEDASRCVLINDAPSSEYAVEALRKGVVLLRARQLFAGTLFQNLQASLGDLSETEIVLHRAEAAAALGKVGLLGRDLDARIDPDALSREEVAQLLVAKALILSPRVLLVDRLFDGLLPDCHRVLLQLIVSPNATWTAIVSSVYTNSAPASGDLAAAWIPQLPGQSA